MRELLRLISARHLRRSPLRSALVLFGIALGVASMVGTLSVNRAILLAFEDLVDRVSGRADLIVTGGEPGVPAELVEELRAVPGVAHVAGSLDVITRIPGDKEPLLLLGVDLVGDPYFLPLSSRSGEDVLEDPFSVVNDPDAVLLPAGLAGRLGKKVGDPLSLLTPAGPHDFVVRAVLEDEGLAAAFGGRVALMFSEAVQAAFAREGKIDRIELALAKGSDRGAVQARLGEVIGGRARLERPDGRAAHLQAVTGPIRRGLAIGGVVALLVGMFLIYNAVAVSVAERRREIGILRALGTLRRTVIALFVLEAGSLALVGGVLGTGLGVLMARGVLVETAPTLSRFYTPIQPRTPELSWDLALLGVTMGFLATVLAALAPARAAARVDPVDSLARARARSPNRRVPYRALLIGSALLVPPAFVLAQIPLLVPAFGAMFVVLVAALLAVPGLIFALRRVLLPVLEARGGIVGRIALDNAERSMGRSALTVSALLTAVASSICTASWGVSLEASMYAWLDQALPADLYVTAGSFIADQHNVPFSPKALETLKTVPGLHSFMPVRITTVDVGAERVQMVSFDITMHEAWNRRKGIEGRPVVSGPRKVDPARMLEAPRVLLGESAARKLQKGVGDRFTVETPAGVRELEVYAVVVDYTSDQGTIFIDRSWALAYWQDPLIDTLDLVLEKGVDPGQVAKMVRERLGAEGSLFVVSNQDVKVEIKKVIQQSLAIFSSAELLALLVAMLGVVGTMISAVLDRIREVGVLRAVGASQGQVVGAVVLEAGFLGLAAALGGVLTGVPMGMVFVRVVGLVGTGWHVDYLFPWAGALRVGLLVVLTAALAGWWPGRNVARMDLPSALAYE